MASADLESKAKEAFIDDHFELAVDLYTQAISLVPGNSELYADRAQANIKLKNFTEAVADANKAIELDPANAKAYLRKGLACIKLEEYHTAKAALERGASLAPGDSRFSKLIEECDELIAEEKLELPKQTVELAPPQAATPSNLRTDVGLTSQGAPAVAPKLKYRHEFYQKLEEVVVTVFAKGIPASRVHVDFGGQILSVTIDVPGEDPYHLQIRLFGKIVPEKSRYDVMSTKMEIRLHKADNLHWTSLEHSNTDGVVRRINVPTATQKLSYPSSKSKGADWDKLEAQVKKEEREEKLDGDAALNKFFQQIFRDADEDTRRAMNKSFVESNGTVLSTNWKEVGAKKVEGTPPDGMELKKWEI